MALIEIAHILYNKSNINYAIKCLNYAMILIEKIDINSCIENNNILNKNMQIDALYDIALYYQKMSKNDEILRCYKLIENYSKNVDNDDDIFLELSIRYAVLGCVSDATRNIKRIYNYSLYKLFKINTPMPFYILADCLIDNGYYEEGLEVFFYIDSNTNQALQDFASKFYKYNKVDYIKKLGEYSLKYPETTVSICAMLAVIYPQHTNKIIEMLCSKNVIEPFIE
jgi:tetratricopeptide (TPR) repeat protein